MLNAKKEPTPNEFPFGVEKEEGRCCYAWSNLGAGEVPLRIIINIHSNMLWFTENTSKTWKELAPAG